jgi:hypothetical protein
MRLQFQKRSELKLVSRIIPLQAGSMTPYTGRNLIITSSCHEFVYRMMYNGFVIFIGRQEDLFLPGR